MDDAPPKPSRWPAVRDGLRRFAPGLSLLLIFVALAVARPDSFLSGQNLSNILRQTTPIAIMAIGETVVIITAGIDLSIGSVLAFGGIIGTAALKLGAPLWLGLALAVAAGGLVGLLNGLLITRSRLLPFLVTGLLILLAGEVCLRQGALLAAWQGTGAWGAVLRPLALRLAVGAAAFALLGWFLRDLEVPPFIATLGTLGMARGYTLYITGGMPIVGMPAGFAALGQGNLGPVPVPAVILLALAVVIHLLLTGTRIGRHAYALGSNREAAHLAGVDVARVTAWAYTLCGMTAGLAGMIMMARMNTGQPTEGAGYELDGIAAVVIGGGSLSGGVGSVPGSIVGAFVMALLRNGGTLLHINDFIQQLAIGAIIVLAVAFDVYRRRQAGAARA